MIATPPPPGLPLAGLRVLEFTQNIMGPSAGLVLADLGADVIKVEPAPLGDATRRLGGFAAGFFSYFNRNKRSLAVDAKQPRGLELVLRLDARTDVVIENYAPGTMDRLGCGYDALARQHSRLRVALPSVEHDDHAEERRRVDEEVRARAKPCDE